MKYIRFPEDFEEKPHPIVHGATQWRYEQPMNMPEPPTGSRIIISIVGGGEGLYGDGITSFEMWDFDEDSPRPYQTKEEINEYLSSKIKERMFRCYTRIPYKE